MHVPPPAHDDAARSPSRRTQRHGSRPPRPVSPDQPASTLSPLNERGHRVLIVDLNNFATFPTLAIGLLVASLRNAGSDVSVLSPLAHDVPAAEREHRESPKDHWMRRIHLSTWTPFIAARNTARRLRQWWINRPDARVLREVDRALRSQPDVVLLSAYLQHRPTVTAIGRMAQQHGVPMLLGGPMFNVAATAEAWRTIPGLVAVVGAEADHSLPGLVDTVVRRGDLLQFDGVMLPDGRRSRPAGPLRDLGELPVPDYTDFPWDRYRLRVIPLMTGRGCQWARCTFCSDVVSANGRSFRTRSVEAVLHEMREQARRHQTSNFVFLDIKLNSNPAMLRGLTEQVQHHVHGAQWVGTVHVDQRKDNGLSPRELRAAAQAGMRRISFGLESGSQRILDAMDKGCTVEANAAFVHHAHEAGLSVRCTMFKGYPGETADDLQRTAEFLERHGRFIDRVRCNEFSIPEETPIAQLLQREPARLPQLRLVQWNARIARAEYEHTDSGSPAYRRAKARMLRAVYEINRRPVRSAAHAFDGLM